MQKAWRKQNKVPQHRGGQRAAKQMLAKDVAAESGWRVGPWRPVCPVAGGWTCLLDQGPLPWLQQDARELKARRSLNPRHSEPSLQGRGRGVYFRNTVQVILVDKENRQGGKIQVRASATGRQGTGTKGEKEGRR